jgi:hypothetical protein
VFDTRLIIISVIAIVTVLTAFFLSSAKWRLRPLQSIIDGQLSLKFILSRLEFVPCLVGTWRGRQTEVTLMRGRRGSVLSIYLITRCSSPCANIVLRPANIYTDVVYNPLCLDMNFFRYAPGFRIPQTNLQAISDAENEDQVRRFLNPARVKIIEDIFSLGFVRFEIRQTDSDSFISAGAQFSALRFKSKRDFFLNPQTVDNILTKLKEFV